MYITISPIVFLFIALVIEYRKKQNFYKELTKNLDELDEKYLISEIIKEPQFQEGKILKNTIKETRKIND